MSVGAEERRSNTTVQLNMMTTMKCITINVTCEPSVKKTHKDLLTHGEMLINSRNISNSAANFTADTTNITCDYKRDIL